MTAAAHADYHRRENAATDPFARGRHGRGMGMVTAVNEWSRWDEGGPTAPIPDLTPSAYTTAPCCGAGWRGMICTRLPGHTGRHAAGDGDFIVAVWGDPTSEAATTAGFDADGVAVGGRHACHNPGCGIAVLDSHPDLSLLPGVRYCYARNPDGCICTRLPGHTGRHAAGDGQHIVAVWADPTSEEPTNAEFDAAVERAAQVIARGCQVCGGGLVVPTGVEYLGATEYGGCSDCYGLAAQVVQVVLHPKEDT